MTQQSSEKEVFFHVGLGKTATTYLQYQFFPKLRGIHYVQRTRYPKAHKIIARDASPRHLLSREFDQQLQEEIEKFAVHFPDTRAIVVFRRHDGWIASQYRRFAKNGIQIPFEEFFDIENDRGLWKQPDLDYSRKLAIIEKTFSRKPLVLFYEDMREDPYAFFDQFASGVGATYDRNQISLDAVHASYEEKQLKTVRSVSKVFFPANPKQYNNAFLRRLQWRKQQLTSYSIMAAARFVPDAWLDPGELVPKVLLEKVRAAYANDWEKVHAYARQNNDEGAPQATLSRTASATTSGSSPSQQS